MSSAAGLPRSRLKLSVSNVSGLSSRRWLICLSLSSVVLDLARSSFDRKVRLVSIKPLCEMFRLALIDLSTWANDVFSVMSNSPGLLFASDLHVEPRARGRVPVLTERGSLPL